MLTIRPTGALLSAPQQLVLSTMPVPFKQAIPISPKLVASACLGALTVLAVGVGAARWLSPTSSGTATHQQSSAALGLSRPDDVVLPQFGFVDRRYPIQIKPTVAAKPRSAQELATLMAETTQQRPETDLRYVATGLQTASGVPAGTFADNHADAIRHGPPADGDPRETERRSPAPMAVSPDFTTGSISRAVGHVNGAEKLPPMALVIERAPTGITKSSLPIDVDISSPRNSRVVIGRVPTGVAFSAGQQAGPGLWQMRIGEFAGADILVDGSAPQAFELAIMLLDSGGTVVNGLDISVRVVESGQAQQPPTEFALSVENMPVSDGEVEDLRVDFVRVAKPNSGAEPNAIRKAPVPTATLGGPVPNSHVRPVARPPEPRDVKPSRPDATVAIRSGSRQPAQVPTSGSVPPSPSAAAPQPLPPPPATTLQSGLSALFPNIKPGEPVKDVGFPQ